MVTLSFLVQIELATMAHFLSFPRIMLVHDPRWPPGDCSPLDLHPSLLERSIIPPLLLSLFLGSCLIHDPRCLPSKCSSCLGPCLVHDSRWYLEDGYRIFLPLLLLHHAIGYWKKAHSGNFSIPSFIALASRNWILEEGQQWRIQFSFLFPFCFKRNW